MSSRVKLLGVEIDNISLNQATARAEQMLQASRLHQVVTPGPEFLLEASANPTFKHVLNQADLALPDGIGLQVASWLTGKNLRSRVTGVDFTLAVLQLCHQHGYRIFLYGGQAGVAEQAAREIGRKYPNAVLAGFESGWRGPWQQLHEQRVVEKIHLAKPHVLLVALGAPKQELWIYRHRQALHDVRLAIGVGRTLDYLAGVTTRPPRLIRQLGLEWLMTFLQAGQHFQPQFRRQRVRNATWHFLRTVIQHPHE